MIERLFINKKKTFILICSILISLLCCVDIVLAEEKNEGVKEEKIFNKIAITILDEINNNDFKNKTKEYGINNINEKVINLASNGFKIDIEGLLSNLGKKLVEQSTETLHRYFRIIIILVISIFIKILSDSFKDEGITKLLNLITNMILIIAFFDVIGFIVELVNKILNDSVSIIKISLPSLIAITTISGKIKSAAMFEPFTFSIINVISILVVKILIPIIYGLSIIIIINNISEREVFKEIIGSIKDGINFIIKTIFVFTISITGINKYTVGILDTGIKEGATKIFSSIIPLVGTSIGESMDIFSRCITSLKNSFCIVIIGILIYVVGKYFITLIINLIVFKAIIIIMSLFLEKKTCECLKDLGEIISFIISSMLYVETVFIISLTMTIST